MPRSEPSRGLTMDMSNLFRLRLRVSLCVFEALPYALTDCSPLTSSTDDMSMLPSLTESLDGCILHSLELRCRVDGSMSMPSASPSASRERSPRTINSPRFSSSPLLSYEYPAPIWLSSANMRNVLSLSFKVAACISVLVITPWKLSSLLLNVAAISLIYCLPIATLCEFRLAVSLPFSLILALILVSSAM